MSRFNHYAKDLERLTLEAVKTLKKAEEKERITYQELSEYPQRHGFVDAKYQLEHEKRKLAHDEAALNLRTLRNSVSIELSKQLSELRSKLKDDADNYFAVEPSQLQPEVVSFLESDMLTLNDYQKLMKTAISDNNVTMIRMIANSANKAADGIEEPSERGKLKIIAAEADKYRTESYLTAYDSLISISDRCTKNLRLANYWNTSLGLDKVIEDF